MCDMMAQGMAMCEKRTEALAPAGPLRVVAIALTLQLFTILDSTGLSPRLPRASMIGTIALCMGFWTEALASFCLLQRHRARSGKQQTALEESVDASNAGEQNMLLDKSSASDSSA